MLRFFRFVKPTALQIPLCIAAQKWYNAKNARKAVTVVPKQSFWEKCRNIFSTYIRSNLLDAAIVGAATAIFLAVMKMPHIFPIALIVGITNMIPTVGPLLGLIAGCLFLVFGTPINALWFLLFTLVLQLIDGYLIKPKLFGSTLGVPSFLVLVATLAGGWLFGVWGILLAVPVAAVLLMIWRDKLKPKMENDTEPEQDEDLSK